MAEDLAKTREGVASAKPGLLQQIVVAVAIALLAGGTAPWWWNALFGPRTAPTTSKTPKQQTPETSTLLAPHAPNIEINQRYTLWEQRLMQFSLGPGESKTIKGGDLYAQVATYPASSCAGPGFVPYTWQIRNPYPGGGDLEIRKILMGGSTERVGLGSMGSGSMGVCDEHTFKNNGLEKIYIELRYASAADLKETSETR